MFRKSLEDFDNDLKDDVFKDACRLRISGVGYLDFIDEISSKYKISRASARELFDKVNDFISVTLNMSPEAIRTELVLKAQAIQRDAKEDKAHGARVSALKLEMELRITESDETETIRHEHVLTLAPPPEPENELNEELEDEVEQDGK